MLIMNTLSFQKSYVKAAVRSGLPPTAHVKIFPSVPLLAEQKIRVVIHGSDVGEHKGATAPTLEHTPQTLALAV